MINTTQVRRFNENKFINLVYSDWQDTNERNDVAKLAFKSVGFKTKIEGKDNINVKHSRTLEIEFSNRKKLTIRLDQGVGYWRNNTGTPFARRFNNAFNFHESDMEIQAKRVANMNILVEASPAPTEIFVKIR